MVQLRLKHNAYINLPMLMRTVGWLLMVLSGFMIFPLITSIIYGDSEIRPIIISMAITIGCAMGLMSLKPKSKEMGKREAILLTSLIWVILSMFGMLPFLLCGTHESISDAFFETMSGFTTTGASVLSSLKDVPHSLLLWRCMLQWIGGLGIILFTLAVVPMLNNKGGMLMFNEEVTGITHDKLRPRVSNTAKSLWGIYICLTITCILLLWFSRMNLFEAICHGLSTMSTGGFSTDDISIRDWNSPYIIIILTVFMFIGGVNFNLLFATVDGDWRKLLKNDAFKWFCMTILFGYLVFTISIIGKHHVHSWQEVTIVPLFQSVSILTSTGLVVPHFNHWGAVPFIVMLIFMAIGGCAGSTSGGAKIDRFIIFFKFLKNEMYRTMYPSAVKTVTVNGRGTSYVIVMKVLAFIALYFLVIFVGGFLLTVLGVPFNESFFYSLSAISNAGIGTEVQDGVSCFSMIPDAAKWILSFVMLTGRLELYTVLLLFTPAFWEK
ncbi:MAG: TrkH family potassium uptake protein [Muribaculaceae bacterium]|nr:TrkH family potassium uptake protein [Muribaculaceae bacterium]